MSMLAKTRTIIGTAGAVAAAAAAVAKVTAAR